VLGAQRQDLAKQLKVGFVKLNGPRYWTLDEIEAKGASISGEMATFGGIGMVHRATLQTTIGDKFYTPNTVKRLSSLPKQAVNSLSTVKFLAKILRDLFDLRITIDQKKSVASHGMAKLLQTMRGKAHEP
jgi:hypothetical protein